MIFGRYDERGEQQIPRVVAQGTPHAEPPSAPRANEGAAPGASGLRGRFILIPAGVSGGGLLIGSNPQQITDGALKCAAMTASRSRFCWASFSCRSSPCKQECLCWAAGLR